jgi:hypothetical protein
MFSVAISLVQSEQGPFLLVLGAAACGACVALLLLIIERPRLFIEYRAARTWGLPIVHVTGTKSRSTPALGSRKPNDVR